MLQPQLLDINLVIRDMHKLLRRVIRGDKLVFKHGNVVYMDAAIRRPTSPLLESLETNSLADFTASAGPEAQAFPDSRYPPP